MTHIHIISDDRNIKSEPFLIPVEYSFSTSGINTTTNSLFPLALSLYIYIYIYIFIYKKN